MGWFPPFRPKSPKSKVQSPKADCRCESRIQRPERRRDIRTLDLEPWTLDSRAHEAFLYGTASECGDAGGDARKTRHRGYAGICRSYYARRWRSKPANKRLRARSRL